MLFGHVSKHALSLGLLAIATSWSIASADDLDDVVSVNGIYGREHSLPFCDWTTEERSLVQFVWDYDQKWLCTSMADQSSCGLQRLLGEIRSR